MFTLAARFGFKGVIDGTDVETGPDVREFPLLLLPLLPVFPVRAPIAVPLLPNPGEDVGAKFEVPLKENGRTPTTITIIGLGFCAAIVPN